MAQRENLIQKNTRTFQNAFYHIVRETITYLNSLILGEVTYQNAVLTNQIFMDVTFGEQLLINANLKEQLLITVFFRDVYLETVISPTP